MSMYDAKPRSVNVSLPGYEDRVAVSILQKYHGVMLDQMSPRATIGKKPLHSRYRRARRPADVNAYPDVDVVNDSCTIQGYII